MVDRLFMCEKARGWAAHRLDGELSETEERLLDAHLAECVECSAFAAEIAEVTVLLRATPLERFTAEVRPRLRQARRTARRGILVAATVLVAGPVIVVAANMSDSSNAGDTPPPMIIVGETLPVYDDVRRGIPVVTHRVLPLGQLKAVDDF